MTGEMEHVYNISAEDEKLLANAFLSNHISVVEVDLQTGTALILKHELNPEREGTKLAWSELLEEYAKSHVYLPDREKVLSITPDQLSLYCQEGTGEFPLEVRCCSDMDNVQWVEIAVAGIGTDGGRVVITTRSIDETVMIRRIVDLFVYQNYDYLYLIDAKKDTYLRFTGSKENIPVPPEMGEHYSNDMASFNRQYVVPEDFERVTANMQLSHVIKKLEQSEMYSFTSGGIAMDGRYRRSRVVFLYYDRAASLILMARTDVTQIYLEEQEKNRQLAEALRSAQHDPMTGIYNQKATGELIGRLLESQYRTMAAVFFIDVDNFKRVNDTQGHQKGDELLCFLAKTILDIAGRDGIAGRLGGDEFLLYMPAASSAREIERIAHKICRMIKLIPDPQLKEYISCSVGISVYPYDGTDYETLLRKADQALYTAKRYGKDQYYFYSCEANQDSAALSPS